MWLRWWAIGAFAAIALILSAVWFWANSFGSSFGRPASADSSFGRNSAPATAEPAAAVPSSLEDSRLAARSDSDQDSDRTREATAIKKSELKGKAKR